MPNEHTLTRAIRRELKARKDAGEMIWGRKLHGSAYQRDLPDWLFCVAGLLVVIETKNRGDVTEGQKRELQAVAAAGGRAAVARDILTVRAILDRAREEAHARGAVRHVPHCPAHPINAACVCGDDVR